MLFALGDGRVTQRSLLTTDESQKAGEPDLKATLLPLTTTFFACGLHTQLFLEKPIQDSFLSALVVAQGKQP